MPRVSLGAKSPRDPEGQDRLLAFRDRVMSRLLRDDVAGGHCLIRRFRCALCADPGSSAPRALRRGEAIAIPSGRNE